MIDMVGIGPFIVIPFVVKTMGGPQAMIAWVTVAVPRVDGRLRLVGTWCCNAQSRGSYFFLRESYGPARWGKAMSFLLIWQTMFQAPLVVASGAIGFAQYFTYLVPLSDSNKKQSQVSCHHPCCSSLQAHHHDRQVVAFIMDGTGNDIHLVDMGRHNTLRSPAGF